VYNNAGLGSGGIFHLFLGGSLDVADTLIVNNTVQLNLMDAGTGGSTTFRNCTIAHNASAGGGDRVSLYFAPSTQIRNCIFWNNTDGGIPAGESGFHTLLLNVDWGTSSVTDNIIQGWSGTLAPTFDANSGADPRFVAAVAPGVGGAPVSPSWYTLQSRSPARDSGWNAGVAGSVDFFGNTRIVDDPYFPNTGFAGGTVDRGCFEMQSPSVICPGDLGSQGGVVGADGVRDNNDFVVFIDLFFLHDPRADLGRQGGIPGADGQYDNNDFVVFIDAFFTLCP
jgi:hypothetical protein